MNTKTYGQYCALAKALDRIGDRWTLLIVRDLLLGPRRYSDLRESLPGIATNLLAERLRRLEADGLVTRRKLPPPAASTVFELTERGRGLEEPILGLIRWASPWMLQRARGERLRPGRLALPLKALICPESTRGVRLVCELRAEGDVFSLRLENGRVEAALGTPGTADIVIEGSPESILMVVGGYMTLVEARRAGRLRIEGDAWAQQELEKVLHSAKREASRRARPGRDLASKATRTQGTR